MDVLLVEIDVIKCQISVYKNGEGIPVEFHQEEGVYVLELMFGHLTGTNFEDNLKKTGGRREDYGVKLTNVFSRVFFF
jgi:DNA topoisomerase-2